MMERSSYSQSPSMARSRTVSSLSFRHILKMAQKSSSGLSSASSTIVEIIHRWRSTGTLNQVLAKVPSSPGDRSETSMKSEVDTVTDGSTKTSRNFSRDMHHPLTFGNCYKFQSVAPC